MGKLINTLAIGSALGVGYLLFKLGTAEAAPTKSKESKESEKSKSANASTKLSGPAKQPTSAPKGLLPEPRHPTPRQRINRSTTDEAMTVRESPTELLRQARRFDPNVTLDELTGARLAASEHGSGSFTELCCIVDAELNRAERRGKSLYQSLTYRDTFGKQGRTRRASTRRDPRIRHLLAARAVISGKARGISRGATRFYDPKAQHRAHKRWKSGKSDRRHCPPLVILERWAFDLPWAKRKGACKLNRTRPGRHKLQWVGPIAGVDPLRLFLMRPATDQHQAFYDVARKLLEDGLPT